MATNGQPASSGITRISVTGFKSLATKTDVEIRPLTVLAGANSSGKSSLMQPLLLMKQTLESAFNPAGPFRLSGPYTNYTESRQFLSRFGSEIESPQRLELDFEIGRRATAGFTFAVDSDGSFGAVETRGSQIDGERAGPWSVTKQSPSDYLERISRSWLGRFDIIGPVEFRADRYKYYLVVQALSSSDAEFSKSQFYELPDTLALNSEIRELIHVPGLRGDQNRKWLLANVSAFIFFAGAAFEGPFEAYVPSLIDQWQTSQDQSKINQLIAGLSFLNMAHGVRTVRVNESEIEVRVPRTAKSDVGGYVNIADVGLAVSTVLSVLVALIQAEPNQLVYIEQPELHLHPRAQWKLAQLLIQAANRGIRLVIETHSSLLIQGILTCVAKSAIAPENVALHWFTRNDEGVTSVRMADLDAQGRVGDWPEDFSNVEMAATNEYLDAVESKLMANQQ